MVEKAKIENQAENQESKETSLENAVSKIETKEGEDSKWLKGAKSFAKGGAKGLGMGIGVLLGLAVMTVAKFIEASAGVMKEMLEDPNHPEKWFKPLKEVWKTERKKEKK